MALLSVSSSVSSNSLSSCPLLGSLEIRNFHSKAPTFSLRPFNSSRCSTGSLPKTKTLAGGGLLFGLQVREYHKSLHSSSLRTQAMATRGADSDVMGLLLRERIVFLGEPISDFVADSIVSQLLLLDAQDPTKDIRLFINSYGGSLSSTLAIYDVIQLVRADVSTVALGVSASTASILLGAGTKGKRLAMPNTRIMIHQPLGGISGKALDMEVQARELMQNKDAVARIISGFTGRAVEQVLKDISKERFMSCIEAVEYGIVDAIIDRDSIIQLEPVPGRRPMPVHIREEFKGLGDKYLKPDIPEDEIY